MTAAEVVLKDFGMTYGKDLKIIPVRSLREAIQEILTDRSNGRLMPRFPDLPRSSQIKRPSHRVDPYANYEKISTSDPVWGLTMIKSGSNPLKLKKNVTPLGIGCGFSKGTHNSADTIYQVLKATYEHHDEWKDVHPIAKRWYVNRAIDNVVQPLHVVAIRYSKEKGIWSGKMEAKQQAKRQALLAQ